VTNEALWVLEPLILLPAGPTLMRPQVE